MRPYLYRALCFYENFESGGLPPLSQAVRGVVLLACFAAFGMQFPLAAAQRGQYYSPQDANTVAIKEMRDSLDDLRHEVGNHEAEIRILDEKLTNFDSIVESVRDQLQEASRSHKEQLKGNSVSLESKITALETTSKSLVADLKQFKTHANDTTTLLAQYKQKLTDLEKILEQQNENIEHLQGAMQSLMEALQGKSSAATSSAPSATSSGISYKVKSGDSLEKIAKLHQTTIQAIKEANGLTTDRIVVGKILIIPDK